MEQLRGQASRRGDECPGLCPSPAWEQQAFWPGSLVHVKMIPDLKCCGGWCGAQTPYEPEVSIPPPSGGGDS